MTRPEALEFAGELVRAVNARDTARLLSLYSENAVARSPMFREIAGRAAIAENWRTLFSLFPDLTVETKEVMVDGPRIALIGAVRATDRNGWFGQTPTGERIDYRCVILLELAAGKIVRDERLYDLAGVLERLEKSRIDKELRTAAEVQRMLLSCKTCRTAHCEAAGDSVPCRSIGGDFFEMIPLASGAFGIALGDVSGKGPAAALLAAMIQGMLAAEAENEARPSAVVGKLNRSLARRKFDARFATLVYGILSPDGRFACTNAGHNPPILLSGGHIRRLTSGGPPLGLFEQAGFEEETLSLGAGDRLVLFSDGVTEARNAADEEFGDDRLIACATGFTAAPPSQMVAGILAHLRKFCGGMPYHDDVTLAVARRIRSIE
ncbi:MAG: SpoIIE family protein phosphatase [Candidatus Sulfopaludibacter sp.]|nr:SpoIIE family protein phosphatase [Candidatus Sulfopaludibacter sp.]